MSVKEPVGSERVRHEPRCNCDNSTILKISSIIVGLLLIGAAIGCHMYQVNAIAVYTLGGSGGVLILATAIGSMIQCAAQNAEGGSSVAYEPIVYEPIVNESPPPQELIARLPEFLQKLAPRIFHFSLPDDTNIDFKAFKDCHHPLILYSQGLNNFGIYMKLQVKHINMDPTYDRSKDILDLGQNLSSSEEPFTIKILSCFVDRGRGEWTLVSKSGAKEHISHRNGAFGTKDILGSNTFVFNNHTLPSRLQIQRFINTRRQDALPKDERTHLAWILLRLLSGYDIEVREWNGRLNEKDEDPAVGYWQISIANQEDKPLTKS